MQNRDIKFFLKKRIFLKGFTLVEVLVALAIFTVIMTLVMAAITGTFNSLRQANKMLDRGQKQRFSLLRLSREVSSIARVSYPGVRFKGEAGQFFFIFAREDSLAEASYVYNASSQTLDRYYEEPTDYNWGTYATKEVSLSNLSECRFSYSDGLTWKESWDENTLQFPKAIKMTYKFQDEDKQREFVVNIPISH